MRYIKADDKVVVELGRQNDDGVTCIQFALDADWLRDLLPGGQFQAIVERPGDSYFYPVVLTVDDEYVSWVVARADVAMTGYGRIQLAYIVDGDERRSKQWSTSILPSINGGGTVPDPAADWVDDVIRAGSDAAEAAEAAETSRQAIEDMGATAESLDPGSDPTVTKHVDPETGAVTLQFGIPQGEVSLLRFEYDAARGEIIAVYPKDSSDYEFFYNENTGELEVEIA